jgi:hypothetical protein
LALAIVSGLAAARLIHLHFEADWEFYALIGCKILDFTALALGLFCPMF